MAYLQHFEEALTSDACLEVHLNISTRRISTDSISRLELAHRFKSLAEGLVPASQADSSSGCSCEGRKSRSRQPKKSGHKSSCSVGASEGKTVSAAFCTGGRLPAKNPRLEGGLVYTEDLSLSSKTSL